MKPLTIIVEKHLNTLFLDLVKKGYVYQQTAPNMWDVDFQTAVSQAEVEDRDLTGAYHDIEFQIEDGDTFTISTTRPELLAACIAVVAHPTINSIFIWKTCNYTTFLS